MRKAKRNGGASGLLAAMCLLVIAAAGQARAGSLPNKGDELFSVYCSSCHGANLEGSLNGPSLRGVSRTKVDFYLTTGRMPASMPGVQNIARTPRFTRAQIDAIVGYVMSRSHGSNTTIRIGTTGNLQRGRALFIANCSACHGATGKGGAVGYGWLAPNLGAASLTQVAQAIRTGPGVMPSFDSRTLDDAEVNDILRYVALLQTKPKQAGGIALGNVGSVAEGMVAWIFGLGLIVIVTRLIGTNA